MADGADIVGGRGEDAAGAEAGGVVGEVAGEVAGVGWEGEVWAAGGLVGVGLRGRDSGEREKREGEVRKWGGRRYLERRVRPAARPIVRARRRKRARRARRKARRVRVR